MHAMAQHCPTPAHAMTMTAPTVIDSSHHAAGHAFSTATQGLTSTMSIVAAAPMAEQPANPLSDMLMLCAAMLLGAGAVLSLLFRGRPGLPLPLPRLHLPTWRPAVLTADTGPPPTLAFVVIRC
jgi:hypothetical protein